MGKNALESAEESNLHTDAADCSRWGSAVMYCDCSSSLSTITIQTHFLFQSQPDSKITVDYDHTASRNCSQKTL